MGLTLVELTGRLVLAAGLGVVVGVERDSSARGAGARRREADRDAIH
jgi:uncharacterized membrane protein YhiD involved in acid resistance